MGGGVGYVMVLKRTRFVFWKKKGGGNDNLCVVSLMGAVTFDHSLVGYFRFSSSLIPGTIFICRIGSRAYYSYSQIITRPRGRSSIVIHSSAGRGYQSLLIAASHDNLSWKAAKPRVIVYDDDVAPTHLLVILGLPTGWKMSFVRKGYIRSTSPCGCHDHDQRAGYLNPRTATSIYVCDKDQGSIVSCPVHGGGITLQRANHS